MATYCHNIQTEVPLTSDGDQPAVTDADDVVPADGLSVFGAGVCHQGSDAAPRCQHVSSAHCRHRKSHNSFRGTRNGPNGRGFLNEGEQALLSVEFTSHFYQTKEKD